MRYRMPEWQIHATEEHIRRTVDHWNGNFRKCLQVFARAAKEPDRTLRVEMIEPKVAGPTGEAPLELFELDDCPEV